MSGFYDYRFKFPHTGLVQALAAMGLLRQLGVLSTGALPANMLGDPRDEAGAILTDGSEPAFVGRPGRAATTTPDDATGAPVPVAAIGDPGFWYVAIRSVVPPAALPSDWSPYGLVPADPAESAAVLGAWE